MGNRVLLNKIQKRLPVFLGFYLLCENTSTNRIKFSLSPILTLFDTFNWFRATGRDVSNNILNFVYSSRDPMRLMKTIV